MATQAILGLFEDANAAADAGDALRSAGIAESDYNFLTDVPYPEGAFGEGMAKHRLFWWPLVGGALGLALALVAASLIPMAYPLTKYPQPILAMPPLSVICYIGAVLGAILFTLVGVVMALRPGAGGGLSDHRIAQGAIGLLVNADASRWSEVTQLLNDAGAVAVKSEDD